MEVTIKVSEEFERQAKRFAKKYKTFVDDFASFLSAILLSYMAYRKWQA